MIELFHYCLLFMIGNLSFLYFLWSIHEECVQNIVIFDTFPTTNITPDGPPKTIFWHWSTMNLRCCPWGAMWIFTLLNPPNLPKIQCSSCLLMSNRNWESAMDIMKNVLPFSKPNIIEFYLQIIWDQLLLWSEFCLSNSGRKKIWLHCSWCYFPTFPIQLSLVFSSRIRVSMWLEFWSEFWSEFKLHCESNSLGQMTSAIFALISQFSHTKWCWFTLIFVYTNNTALFCSLLFRR